MLCPSCKTNLTMSERQGIEIDYCPSCRGVWLDRGELDKIIERSAESAPPQHQAPPPPPQGYQQPWGGAAHDPRYHKKRRKNFLEELFD
ncbi:MAG TPA: zf-TFIIB domain-containing protein [Sphingomicrobium sp.]|nr:zf-TFIIB domain-containing protein [Sphingomicrobium sp.]